MEVEDASRRWETCRAAGLLRADMRGMVMELEDMEGTDMRMGMMRMRTKMMGLVTRGQIGTLAASGGAFFEL